LLCILTDPKKNYHALFNTHKLQARKNAIVVTQLKDPKGNGDMQAVKRDWNAPPIRDVNIWLCGRGKVLGQSIGIDEKNTFQLNFYCSIKTVWATVLGGLWA